MRMTLTIFAGGSWPTTLSRITFMEERRAQNVELRVRSYALCSLLYALCYKENLVMEYKFKVGKSLRLGESPDTDEVLHALVSSSMDHVEIGYVPYCDDPEWAESVRKKLEHMLISYLGYQNNTNRNPQH